MSVTAPQQQHRFTVGTIAPGEPVRAMLRGQAADLCYSSPPWDDAHVKMYAPGVFDWSSFFHTLTEIVAAHVHGWVFIESGLAMADNAAAILSQACVDVTIHSTVYGPKKAQLPNRLLVGHTGKAVRGTWHLPPGSEVGGAAQPRRILETVAQPGQTLLDPCCTNVYGAQAAKRLGLSFYGNDHNPNRAEAIRRLLET
jgi:hypothetical protein